MAMEWFNPRPDEADTIPVGMGLNRIQGGTLR